MPWLPRIVSEKKKYIYTPIPKVACSSLKAVIALDLGLSLENKTIHEVKFPLIDPEKADSAGSFFRFAFVRNPWARLLSCYLDKIRSYPMTDRWFEDGVYRTFLDKYPGQFKRAMSFRDFVRVIVNIKDEQAEGHFLSQHVYLKSVNGKIVQDFIGRFENIEHDFKLVAARIGFEGQLPFLNPSPSRVRYQDYCDAETVKMVAERYREDIQLFDYKFLRE